MTNDKPDVELQMPSELDLVRHGPDPSLEPLLPGCERPSNEFSFSVGFVAQNAGANCSA